MFDNNVSAIADTSSECGGDIIHVSNDNLLPPKREIIVIRGPHGSGKTHWANTLADKLNGKVASVDHYFERSGDYQFSLEKLPFAYAFAEGQVDAFMHEGATPIIVDGAHHRQVYIQPYIDLAKLWDYSLKISYPPLDGIFDVDKCLARASHNVLRRTIENQIRKFEHNLSIPEFKMTG